MFVSYSRKNSGFCCYHNNSQFNPRSQQSLNSTENGSALLWNFPQVSKYLAAVEFSQSVARLDVLHKNPFET